MNPFRAALSHRDFRLLCAALSVSTAGNWLYNVALLVYVFDRTHSAGWVGAATFLRLAPMVVFSPFGGALADRFDRRTVMIASDLARAVLMLGMVLVTVFSGPVPAAVLIAFVATTAGTPFNPAVGAATPLLVPETDLAAANAVVRTIENTALVAGPAVGAILLAVASPAFAFGFNGVSFVASALAVSSIRARFTPEAAATRPPYLATIREGLRVFRASLDAAILPGFMMGASFIYGAETVLLVLVSDRLLGTGSHGLGYLIAAVGLGGVLAAGASTRLVDDDRPEVPLALALVAMGAPLAVLPVVHRPAIAFLVMMVQGAGVVVVDVLVLTLLQRRLQQGIIASALGIVDSAVVASTLTGSLLAPILAGVFGLAPVLVGVGLVVPAIALATLPALRRTARVAGEHRRRLAPTVGVLARVPLFEGATRVALERLASSATVETVPAATAAVVEGEPAGDFYVIRSGVFDVLSTGAGQRVPSVINTLGPGDHFGEIGLVARIPRTASVIARDESSVLRIPGDDFLAVIGASPSVSATLFEGVVGRLGRSHPSLRPVAVGSGPAGADGHAAALLAELARLATDIGPALTPVGHDELLQSITDAARQLFDAAACSLALLDDDGDQLTFRVASGEGAEDVVGLRIPAAQGIAGWVVVSGQPIAIEEVASDPRFVADVARSTGYLPRTILAMPLETERRMLGVIEVLDRRRGSRRRSSARRDPAGEAVGADDMALLALFARQAALAIETSRTFSDLAGVLMPALARAASGMELRAALETQAENAPRADADLAELALLFHDLGQLGPDEKRAATRLARDFLAYARRRR